MTGWDELWNSARSPSQGSTLADSDRRQWLELDFAPLSEASWSAAVRHLAAALGLMRGTSVFEVGCGAGALLYELDRLGCTVGGVDLLAGARCQGRGGHTFRTLCSV